MQLELKNASLRAGDQLKVKLFILHDAERFQIDLGCDEDHIALHFNPRFNDDADGSVIVCNSKAAGCWGEEKREIQNPLLRGADAKIEVKLVGDVFEIELPNGHEMQFPNREDTDVISYIKITGDIKLNSLKIC